MRFVMLTGAFLFVVAESGGAQNRAPVPCTAFPAATDTIDLIIQGRLYPRDSTKQIPPTRSRRILEAIAAYLQLSANLALPVLVANPVPEDRRRQKSVKASKDTLLAWPQFSGKVEFLPTGDGALVSRSISSSSFTPGLDSAMLNAVAMVTREGALKEAGLPDDLGRMEFGLSADRVLDSSAVSLGRTRAGAYRVDYKDIEQLATGSPHYPEQLRMAGIEGFASFVFAVNDRGLIVPGTARLIKASHRGFAVAVIEAMPRLRFIPPIAAGCPIYGWAQQEFQFKLDR